MSNWSGLGDIISRASGFCRSLADSQVHIEELRNIGLVRIILRG